MASIEQFDATATRIAAEVGTVVVSVEYRLAPEHPFPASLISRSKPGPRSSPPARANWASTPAASASPGRAREAASPLR
jgi:hypothetical protein